MAVLPASKLHGTGFLCRAQQSHLAAVRALALPGVFCRCPIVFCALTPASLLFWRPPCILCRLHAVRVGRLSVLLAALPPQLQPQSQLSQSPSWRDDSQHSKPRSRGGAGSGRPSREPSPMGLRQSLSRLQHASGSSGGNRPLGRRSVDHSAQEGGSRTPGSSGGADTAAVWGHDGFHANDHKPLQRRMSHDRDRHGSHGCGTPDTRSWHHDVSSPSAAAAAAIGSKPGAYVAPFRRDDPLSAVPASLRTHNASGASSPAHTPASPRVTRTSPDAMGVPGSPRVIRTSPDAAAEHHQFPTYAAAALAESPLASGEPRSPGKPPAGLRPSPSSGHRPSGLSGASSAAGTPRKGAAPRAAVDAVLADVLAAAAIVKARDDASGDGGDGGGALKSRLSGQRGSSPSASVEEIGGLINKIITSPIVRCGSGDQSAFATPTVTDAAAAAAAGLTGPEAMAVGDLISKILSDIPAPGASPTSGSGPRSPEGMLSPKVSPKKQQQQPRQQPEGTGSNAAPGVGPIAASVAPAAGGCGADHGSAIAMGRQLSVVPEGNEMERLMSAQLDGSLFAAAQQAIAIDRELSLGLRDEAGMLALAAAVGSPQRLSANRAAAQAAAKQAGGETTLTFSPPAAASQPIAITGKPPLAGEDHSGDSSDGGEGGEGGKTGRRRRTRRSRRRSCVTPSEGAVGSPALSNDGGSLPPTAAQMRDVPRQRRNSSGSAAASRRVSDGASAAGVGGGGNKDGSGSEASKAKKHTKKDYAAWAAATPEYRAEASAKYGSGAGSLPPASPPRPRSALSPMASPPRARRPSDGHHAHDVHGVSHAVPSKGPDGSRGFAMGRGKPLAPPPPA